MATTSQTFSANGGFTWQAPAGVNTVQAECWGSGADNQIQTGGAGGSYAKTNAVSVVPGTVYNVYVAGTGAGNVSQFYLGASIYCKAIGGTTSISGSIGDTLVAGGAGGGHSGNGGGGGGGCGNGAAGNGVASSGNPGGAGGTGGNGGGNGGNGGNSGSDGQNGHAPGGGAGGGGAGSAFAAIGAIGQVKLTWTVPTNVLIACTIS